MNARHDDDVVHGYYKTETILCIPGRRGRNNRIHQERCANRNNDLRFQVPKRRRVTAATVEGWLRASGGARLGSRMALLVPANAGSQSSALCAYARVIVACPTTKVLPPRDMAVGAMTPFRQSRSPLTRTHASFDPEYA